MSRRRTVAYAVVAAGLVLWAALAADTLPLVLLAAGSLVAALIHLGPNGTRPDPRDAEDAALQIAQHRRHAEGHFL